MHHDIEFRSPTKVAKSVDYKKLLNGRLEIKNTVNEFRSKNIAAA